MEKARLGEWGEEKAVSFLKKRGYRILDRNFRRQVSRFLKSEVDIVAKKDGVFSFVEVKALSAPAPVRPEEKVTKAKLGKVKKTAESWFTKNNISFNVPWRIDVLSIFKKQRGEVEIKHFKNVAASE